jgi:hypothetical protein
MTTTPRASASTAASAAAGRAGPGDWARLSASSQALVQSLIAHLAMLENLPPTKLDTTIRAHHHRQELEEFSEQFRARLATLRASEVQEREKRVVPPKGKAKGKIKAACDASAHPPLTRRGYRRLRRGTHRRSLSRAERRRLTASRPGQTDRSIAAPIGATAQCRWFRPITRDDELPQASRASPNGPEAVIHQCQCPLHCLGRAPRPHRRRTQE